MVVCTAQDAHLEVEVVIDDAEDERKVRRLQEMHEQLVGVAA